MHTDPTRSPQPSTDSTDDYLQPVEFIDSDDAAIRAFARQHAGGADDRERVVNLYYAVRDLVAYNPYFVGRKRDYYSASACLSEGQGFCIPKAALLAACCRAVRIPARVGYADVRNHVSTPRLEALVGGDVYTWHSYTDTLINGRWVKSTPAFDAALCERLNVHPLAFDGRTDSLFQEYNRAGDRHMEYIKRRGHFADVPYDLIVADFARHHPDWLDNRGD